MKRSVLSIHQLRQIPLQRMIPRRGILSLQGILPLSKILSMSRILAFIGIVLTVVSCQSRPSQTASDNEGDTLHFKYAQHLTIVKYKHYTEVKLADPWHAGKILHTYLLVPTTEGEVPHLPQGTVVRTPLKRIIPFTTVHASLLLALHQSKRIAGVADLQYIKIPWIQQQCRQHKMADVGNAMSPDIEKIITTDPDALMISPFENSGGYGKVEALGVPIIECADYMETSAMGRAEWMRFYGMLVGAEKEADKLFAQVDSNYTALRDKAHHSATNRSVLMDKKTGSVWYVPGGKSTMGMMMADANVRYAFSTDKHAGSLSLPFETVLDQAGESDIWMFRYDSMQPTTIAALCAEFAGYSQLKAVKTGMCYGCNVSTSRFYEESPFRPDYLLADFIRIVHPGIVPGPLRYFTKIAK